MVATDLAVVATSNLAFVATTAVVAAKVTIGLTRAAGVVAAAVVAAEVTIGLTRAAGIVEAMCAAARRDALQVLLGQMRDWVLSLLGGGGVLYA